MFSIGRIVTADQTVRVAAGMEDFNLLLQDESILAKSLGFRKLKAKKRRIS